MAINVMLNGTPLTDVITLSIRLQLNASLQNSDPMPLEVSGMRKVGEQAGNLTDQLTFSVLRGADDKAGIQPVVGTIDLTDDNSQQAMIGTWNFSQCFVEHYATSDSGNDLSESFALRANQVTYSKNGGPATPILDIHKPKNERT